MHLVLLNKLLMNPVPFLALAQQLGTAAGIINAVGLVAMFGGLVGATIAALSERHVGGVKTSLIITAVGGLAFVIAQAMFAAGGQQTNIQLQPIN
jgi:heme/copper-type cytochrome/quinol oxidase subunit 3